MGWDLYGLLGIGKTTRPRMQALVHAQRLLPTHRWADLHHRPRDAAGSWLDYGMFLQNIMTAFVPGPATCPQAAFTQFHGLIADELQLAPEQMLVAACRWLEPTPAAVENSLVSERAPVAEFTRFLEDWREPAPRRLVAPSPGC